MKKNIDIEIIRIIACFFVIFNHTFSMGFSLFLTREPSEPEYWIYLFLTIFCKVAVPLFFCVSGALLLPKEEDVKNIYKHRVWKFTLILVIWSMFYYFLETKGRDMNLWEFFSELLSSRINFSFWYLDALLAFLVTLPILRKIVIALTNFEWRYLILLSVILKGLLPVVEFFLWNGEAAIYTSFKPSWVIANVFIYPCVGYYLYYKFDCEKDSKYIPHLWICNLFFLYVSCVLTYINLTLTGQNNESGMQKFLENFDLVNCICVFLTVKCLIRKIDIKPKIEKLLLSLGKATFGIYLLHILIIREFSFLKVIYRYLIDVWRINDMLAGIVYCLMVFFVGYILSLILRKIPYINKLL